jgi:DNA repair protein SbcC/Rad50
VTIQIAHIGLRNLRSYRAADVPLGPGTTLLSGDIGSGKTSLLYAVEMALFGFAEVDPRYLIRHGAKDAEVALTLTDGAHRWELRRRFVRRARKGKEAFEPTENSLAIDGQRATYSATELRRRTIELLGFPDNPNPRAHSDVWRWAVYLAQERMRDVLDPDSDARMETVRKALGVEQYRLAGENARGLARSLRERADDLAEQGARHRGIEDEAAQWKQAEGVAREQLAALDAREAALREEQKQARSLLEQLETQRRAFELAGEAIAHQQRLAEELDRSIQQERAAQQSSREQLARLQTDLSLESAATTPGQAIHALEPLRLRREQFIRQLTDLEGLRGQATGIDEQLARAKERDRELTARHKATLRELTTVRAERTNLEKTEPTQEPLPPDERTQLQLASERNKVEDVRRSLDRQLATATAELQELAEIVRDGVCPRCHRPVEPTEFESHRGEQESQVVGLQRELDGASRTLDALDARSLERLNYDRTHDLWDQLELRRADLRTREAVVRATSVDEDALQAQLLAERSTLERRRQSLTERLPELERVQAEIALVDREIVETEDRARAAAARAERIAALELRIPEVQTELDLRARTEAERTTRRNEILRRIEEDRHRLTASPDLEERWKAARQRTEELGAHLEELLREASGPRGKLAEASARMDELARRLRERESFEQHAAHLGSLSEWMNTNFRSAMLELEQRRLYQGRQQFERRFSRYFAALVDDPALTARLDETFAPWVDISGQPTPAEALSGGERTALALAFRLALGRTVREAGRLALETLILDEPTEGFSQEQTLRMGDLLEELGLPQVILVSHERQLEGIADRVVRVRKKDGISTVEETDRGTELTPTPNVEIADAPTKPPVPARRRKIRRLSVLDATEGAEGAPHAK